MKRVQKFHSADQVADCAAQDAVSTLARAITLHGSAVWVLAGGTSPLLAYRDMISKYAADLDWSKVTILIGDERMVPLGSPDSNWGTIVPLFMADENLRSVQQIVPGVELDEITAAHWYEQAIQSLPLHASKRFDLVWLGVGEDGHTLSLFPGHPGFTEQSDQLVIPVYDSPKPPSIRITLTLKALEGAAKAVIFAVGAAKADALRRVNQGEPLPIGVAAQTVEDHGGDVLWLYDSPDTQVS